MTMSWMTTPGRFRYLIVNTGNGGRGRKFLISTQWIDRVSWSDATVFFKISGETIRQSPEYTEDSRLNRDYETGLHHHHHRKGYWDDQLVDV